MEASNFHSSTTMMNCSSLL